MCFTPAHISECYELQIFTNIQILREQVFALLQRLFPNVTDLYGLQILGEQVFV